MRMFHQNISMGMYAATFLGPSTNTFGRLVVSYYALALASAELFSVHILGSNCGTACLVRLLGNCTRI